MYLLISQLDSLCRVAAVVAVFAPFHLNTILSNIKSKREISFKVKWHTEQKKIICNVPGQRCGVSLYTLRAESSIHTRTHARHNQLIPYIPLCGYKLKWWIWMWDWVWGWDMGRVRAERICFIIETKWEQDRRRRKKRGEKRRWLLDWITKLAMAQMNRLNENDFDLFFSSRCYAAAILLDYIYTHLMDKVFATNMICELETN